ncbi:ATP-binding protein [Pseudoalteromonas mariniglutinosa]|uniref:ATP-binding protein n=1 Tax=Pseudoalteromonas mariniglutinosa TaxID=206042 RepID=UPI00384C0805
MKNLFTLTFSIAFAYFSTGYLSNSLLAIEGYAVAAWPPSGIALACFLLWQLRAFAGVLIGALLTNLIHLDQVADILHWQVFLQAVSVTSASTLQAWLAYFIINKLFDPPLALSSLKQSIPSLIIGGPLCCLIAASLGTMWLVINQVIAPYNAMNNFIAWWIGDSIGVLIFTPLVIAAFSYRYVNQRLLIILPSLLIYMIICFSFYSAASVKKEKDQQRQQAKVTAIQTNLAHRLDEIQSHLALLATFIASTDEMTYDEFKRFTGRQLQYSDEIAAFEWLPRVTREELLTHQQMISVELRSHYHVKEKLASGQWQSVQPRDNYFPVQYIYPSEYSELVLGFDVASEQMFAQLLNQARTTKKMLVSEPIPLMLSDHNEQGVLFFHPVFADLNNQYGFKGFAVAIVNLETLAESLNYNQNTDINASFYDLTKPAKPLEMFNANRVGTSQIAEYTLAVGERVWQVLLSEPVKYSSWLAYWFAQIVGMLFVWLLITFLISVTGTNIQVREQVEKQTKTLRKEKQKADKASQIKSEFLANMSHEVRTPINGIKGLHYLALQQQDWSQAKGYIEQADNALSVLQRVLNDVLDFSKIEAGKLELHQEPVDINNLVTEMRNLLQFELNIKSLEWVIDYDWAQHLIIDTDPIRLKQVLLNLLNNAVKFTPQGRITLKIWQHHDMTHFSVIDTGIGISEAVQPLLFEPFSQADSSTSRQFGGTGLGLSICKKLITMMGGDISFSSKRQEGSSFTFRLPIISPLEKAQPLDSKLEHIAVVSASFANVQLLLVEDNPLNQQVASAILQTKGCLPDIAKDGCEAIKMLSEKSYDLVLMDIQMPNMDGLQATKVIRDELMMTTLPIIGLSANAHDDDYKQALACGMNGYLTKPIDADMLFQTLYQHLMGQ